MLDPQTSNDPTGPPCVDRPGSVGWHGATTESDFNIRSRDLCHVLAGRLAHRSSAVAEVSAQTHPVTEQEQQQGAINPQGPHARWLDLPPAHAASISSLLDPDG